MNQEIMDLLIKFRDERDWKPYHSPENLAKSISIEAGELLECFQWSSSFEKFHVEEELADVIIYSMLLTNTLGLDMNTIVRKKIIKNDKKYPVSKSKGRSTKYNKL